MIFLVPFHPQHGPLPFDTTLLPPRRTIAKASKYELSRLRSARAAQLAAGAPATIPLGKIRDVLVIACKEIEAGTVPLVIRRVLQNRTCEDWCLIQQLLATHPDLKNPQNLLTISTG
jgi:DNA-directed RNA polymerase subunit K/omega